MIASHALRWILTVLFALLAAFSSFRALRPGVPRVRSAADRTTHTLHAAMGVAMAVMVWPQGMRVPATPQAVFFALGAGWFVASVLFRGRWAWRSPAGEGHSRTHAGLHALMTAAMAWMLLAMPGGTPGSHPAGRGSGSMADMPGMGASRTGGATSMELHGGSRTAATVLLVVFVVVALWWFSRALTAAGTATHTPDVDKAARAEPLTADSLVLRRAMDAGCHGAMALGMAVMLLVMT